MYGLTEAFPIAVKRSVRSACREPPVGRTTTSTWPSWTPMAVPWWTQSAKSPVAGLTGGDEPGLRRGVGAGLLVRRHDEWFRTGDLGCLDAARNLTYVDRAKDVIRRRGENVSSVEVETVVTGYWGIAEAAAVGVPSALGEEDILSYSVSRPAPCSIRPACSTIARSGCRTSAFRVTSAWCRNCRGTSSGACARIYCVPKASVRTVGTAKPTVTWSDAEPVETRGDRHVVRLSAAARSGEHCRARRDSQPRRTPQPVVLRRGPRHSGSPPSSIPVPRSPSVVRRTRRFGRPSTGARAGSSRSTTRSTSTE